MIGILCAALIAGTAAHAQPAAPGAAPAEQAEPARPKPKPKPRGPRPAAAVTLINATANVATEVTVTGEGKTATLSKPLAPKARATLKLPRLKACTVSVAATFEGEGQVEAGSYDICKEKSIRFTE